MSWLIIQHATDGRMYAVTLATFTSVYEALGFVGLVYENGDVYTP